MIKHTLVVFIFYQRFWFHWSPSRLKYWTCYVLLRARFSPQALSLIFVIFYNCDPLPPCGSSGLRFLLCDDLYNIFFFSQVKLKASTPDRARAAQMDRRVLAVVLDKENRWLTCGDVNCSDTFIIFKTRFLCLCIWNVLLVVNICFQTSLCDFSVRPFVNINKIFCLYLLPRHRIVCDVFVRFLNSL